MVSMDKVNKCLLFNIITNLIYRLLELPRISKNHEWEREVSPSIPSHLLSIMYQGPLFWHLSLWQLWRYWLVKPRSHLDVMTLFKFPYHVPSWHIQLVIFCVNRDPPCEGIWSPLFWWPLVCSKTSQGLRPLLHYKFVDSPYGCHPPILQYLIKRPTFFY